MYFISTKYIRLRDYYLTSYHVGEKGLWAVFRAVVYTFHMS